MRGIDTGLVAAGVLGALASAAHETDSFDARQRTGPHSLETCTEYPKVDACELCCFQRCQHM